MLNKRYVALFFETPKRHNTQSHSKQLAVQKKHESLFTCLLEFDEHIIDEITIFTKICTKNYIERFVNEISRWIEPWMMYHG
jgi:hypothetical protein